MLKTKRFYEKNTHIVSSPVNITFEEVVSKNEQQFEDWVLDVRKEVLHIWDTYLTFSVGIPFIQFGNLTFIVWKPYFHSLETLLP